VRHAHGINFERSDESSRHAVFSRQRVQMSSSNAPVMAQLSAGIIGAITNGRLCARMQTASQTLCICLRLFLNLLVISHLINGILRFLRATSEWEAARRGKLMRLPAAN